MLLTLWTNGMGSRKGRSMGKFIGFGGYSVAWDVIPDMLRGYRSPSTARVEILAKFTLSDPSGRGLVSVNGLSASIVFDQSAFPSRSPGVPEFNGDAKPMSTKYFTGVTTMAELVGRMSGAWLHPSLKQDSLDRGDIEDLGTAIERNVLAEFRRELRRCRREGLRFHWRPGGDD